MDIVILMVVSFIEVLFDSIVCFVNVLGNLGRLFREFHFSNPDPANVLEWFLVWAFLAVPLSYLLFRRYFIPRATDGREEEEEEEEAEEEEEEEEEEVEYLPPPCPVCGERLCYECQLFKRIDWTSFTSGERVIELEEPIRDEGRLRQFILEQDPDVDIRIRHRSYYADGACVDETKVVLTKYPATKSATKT